MKTLSQILVVLVAGMVTAGAAQPAKDKDNPELSHVGIVTNSPTGASFLLNIKEEPRFSMGSNKEVTGLFVDCFQPKQTWSLFTPVVFGQATTPANAALIPPVVAPAPNNDAVRHEPNFAVLKVSFP